MTYVRSYRILSLLLFSIVFFFITCTKAHTATTSHLAIVHVNSDRFYNYDFTADSAVANKVDWPVTLFFWNNANVAKVKLWTPYGSPEHAYYNDSNTGWHWDNDDGSKSSECVAPSTTPLTVYHYRVYGRLYDLNFGYYVFATSHIDYNECFSWVPYSPSPWTGESERAEKHIANIFQNHGKTVVYDALSFGNPEPYRDENGHRWSNDGLATAINIP